jgi:hypothetical protein
MRKYPQESHDSRPKLALKGLIGKYWRTSESFEGRKISKRSDNSDWFVGARRIVGSVVHRNVVTLI